MSLSKLYSEHMKHHSFGYALYHPTFNSELDVGACGFFDKSGNWNRIGNIADAASLSKYGLRPIDTEDLKRAPTDDKGAWSCLLATGTKSRTLAAESEVKLVYIPGVELGQGLTKFAEAIQQAFPLPPKRGSNTHLTWPSVPFSYHYPTSATKNTTS
jgi:hypothetical protein